MMPEFEVTLSSMLHTAMEELSAAQLLLDSVELTPVLIRMLCFNFHSARSLAMVVPPIRKFARCRPVPTVIGQGIRASCTIISTRKGSNAAIGDGVPCVVCGSSSFGLCRLRMVVFAFFLIDLSFSRVAHDVHSFYGRILPFRQVPFCKLSPPRPLQDVSAV